MPSTLFVLFTSASLELTEVSGFGKDQSCPAERDEIELPLHDERKSGLWRHEAQIEADADLSQVILIGRQEGLLLFLGVEQLHREGTPIVHELAARVASLPSGLGEELQRLLRVVVVLGIVRILVQTRVVRVQRQRFVEVQLLDNQLPVQQQARAPS